MRNRLISVMLCTLTFAPLTITGAQASSLAQATRHISERFPNVTADDVAVSPVPGVFEVVLGGEVVYVSTDGRYVFTGTLFDLESRKDLTEPARAKVRLKAVNAVPEDRMIIFEPSGETRHTITTFTDIDCPYCRRMHSEISELTGMGIRVRYMFYPRAGVGSDSYDKAVSVWCARDRRAELTRAKAGQRPPKRQCENPVREHMRLASDLGLSGTPMTVTDSGERITGYVPPASLWRRLEAAERTK